MNTPTIAQNIDGIIGSMTVGMIEIIEVVTTIDHYLSKS